MNVTESDVVYEVDIATPLVTVATAVFVAELTDEDALLIVTLATKIRPLIVFVSGVFPSSAIFFVTVKIPLLTGFSFF